MRRIARSIEIAGWLLLAAIPMTLLAPGCQGRECESDGFKDYGLGPGEGHLVDANTWETTPNNAPWIPFGPYHTWVLHPVGLEGRDFLLIQTYYSADPDPNSPGKNATIASGNGATFNVSSDSRSVFVTNSTCAPTYLRVVIVADPAEPSPITGDDAGVDDAGADDAAGDGAGTPDLDAGDGGD